MIGPGTGVRVYLACGVTDMRKGISGLDAIERRLDRLSDKIPSEWGVAKVVIFVIGSLMMAAIAGQELLARSGRPIPGDAGPDCESEINKPGRSNTGEAARNAVTESEKPGW